MRLVNSKLPAQIRFFNQCFSRYKSYLIYLVLLVCLLSAIVGYLTHKTHFKDQLTQLNSEELLLRQQLTKNLAVDANLKKYLSALTLAKQGLFDTLEYSIDISQSVSQSVSHFQNIFKLAEKHQLQVLNIQWLKQRTEAAYSIIPVSLELQGNYHSFAHLCSDLSNLSSLVIITHVFINKAHKHQLTFKITVNTYQLDHKFMNNETEK